MPRIPALRTLRQEDLKFEASLSYINKSLSQETGREEREGVKKGV
jgi:hypothetical protein